MADEVVEVTIRPDGTVSIGVEGMPGGRCLEETADLVDGLGGHVESREMTAEAYVDDDRILDDRSRDERREVGR